MEKGGGGSAYQTSPSTPSKRRSAGVLWRWGVMVALPNSRFSPAMTLLAERRHAICWRPWQMPLVVSGGSWQEGRRGWMGVLTEDGDAHLEERGVGVFINVSTGVERMGLAG